MSLKNLSFLVSLWLIICSFAFSVQAQQSEHKRIFSIYNHSIEQDFDYSYMDRLGIIHTYQKEDFDHFNIGLGYRIIKNANRFQEFSLVQLNYSKGDDLYLLDDPDSNIFEPSAGNFSREVNLRLRWEYGLNVPLNNNDKIIPGISVGIDPFWNYYRNVPKTSAGFPVTFHQFGWDLRLLPTTAFQISSRMQIHLSIPIGVVHNRWNRTKVENPILSEDQRNQASFDSDFGVVDWQLRVGVGLGL